MLGYQAVEGCPGEGWVSLSLQDFTVPQGGGTRPPKDRKPCPARHRHDGGAGQTGAAPGEGKADPSSWFSLQLPSATEEQVLLLLRRLFGHLCCITTVAGVSLFAESTFFTTKLSMYLHLYVCVHIVWLVLEGGFFFLCYRQFVRHWKPRSPG